MRILIGTLFVFFSIITQAADLKDPDGSLKKMTWAHYTAWHNPLDTGFAVGKFYNYPVVKSSGNQIADYRKEFELAKQQGIKGFFVDIITYDGQGAHYANQMKTMLKAAEGTDFLVGPCLDRTPKVDWQIKELTRILKECGDHPNYPKVGNKYVVATYSWYRSPESWKEIREGMAKNGYPIYLIANLGRGYQKLTAETIAKYAGTYEMAYAFGYLSLTGKTPTEMLQLMKKEGSKSNARLMCPVWPGYVGAWMNGRNDYYQPHIGFDQVLDYFDAIFALSSDWIHFTTWNDHDETPLMPMSFGFGGNTIINRYLLDRWRNLPLPSESQMFFAYHREEIIGTVLRIEGLLLPGKNKEAITVSGYLANTAGNPVYKLTVMKPEVSKRNKYARFEWNIPTAELGKYPAVTPVITVAAGNKRTAELPPVMLKTGWLQNQTTMKVPFNLMLDGGKADLTISQDDNLLTAKVKFTSPEEIVQAELFRNDRPIGPMTAEPPSKPLFFTQFNILKRNNLAVRVIDGKIIEAARKSTSSDSTKFAWTKEGFAALQNATWHPVKVQMEMGKGGYMAVKVNRRPPMKISLTQLLDQHDIHIYPNKEFLSVQMCDYDNSVNDRNNMSCRKHGTLSLNLWSRTKLDNDIFYVQFKTASGKIFFSPLVTPFTSGSMTNQNVLQTMVNLETSSGASGQPGRTGYLTTPPFTSPEITNVPVHPANLRKGRWTFERDAWDDLGERPVATAKNTTWKSYKKFISNGGVNGGKCVKLDGKGGIKMRGRIWPMGPCTIDLYIKPGVYPSEKAGIVSRTGWASGFNLYLLEDGKIEAVRDSLERNVNPCSMTSSKAIPVDKWSRIRLTYDGSKAILYINGKVTAEKNMPFHMKYGNCTAVIGKGFTGLIDDLTILSYPASPGDKSFPKAVKHVKTVPVTQLDKANSTDIFKYPSAKGDKTQMKLAKMMSVFGAATVSIAATAAPAKVELGKLIKKLDPPKPNKYCVEVKGNPSMTQPDEKLTKGAVTVGKDGAFSISTNAKVGSTQEITVPVKIKEGQELVVKVKNVTLPAKPKGWIATFIGLTSDKKVNYAAALSNGRLYIAQRAPKWKPLGGSISFKYPITLQIRRYKGMLTFVVNGSPRVAIKEGKNVADVPYFYIATQKKDNWSILDISSLELREVNKAAVDKEKKPVRTL